MSSIQRRYHYFNIMYSQKCKHKNVFGNIFRMDQICPEEDAKLM